MPRPHRLPGATLDLVEVYLAEFTQAGFLAVSSAEDGARAFCARFGSIAGWAAAPLDAQVGVDERVRRFVAWLALTARMPVSAGLPDRPPSPAWPDHGRLPPDDVSRVR